MKVRIHPADIWGCGHYRLIWPGQTLKAQGMDVEVTIPGQDSGIGGVIINGRLANIDVPMDVDVFVLQRPSNILAVDLIRLLRKHGKAVVVDMDDDLTRIHPHNIAFHLLHPGKSPSNNWQLATEGCKLATLITTSTPPLAKRYGTYGICRVLRNCIPSRFLDIERTPNEQPVWGWGGALMSHPDDLPILGGTVNAMNRLGYNFRIIGHQDGTGRALGLDRDPEGPGAVPFEDWMTHVAQLDVGVAPLSDSEFNRGKSWLKPLEYGAVGVPWVASATEEYGHLQAQGGGFVVKNRTRDWTLAVRRLMEDEALWQEESERVRDVASRFTLEEHAWRWWETWEFAHKVNRNTMTQVRPRPQLKLPT